MKAVAYVEYIGEGVGGTTDEPEVLIRFRGGTIQDKREACRQLAIYYLRPELLSTLPGVLEAATDLLTQAENDVRPLSFTGLVAAVKRAGIDVTKLGAVQLAPTDPPPPSPPEGGVVRLLPRDSCSKAEKGWSAE